MTVCYSFFSLTAMCQIRICIFVSLFLKKIRRPVLVSYKLELGICLIISDVSLKFSSAFQNKGATLERCSPKLVILKKHVMKCSSSVPVVKSRKALHANLLKIALPHRYFSKNLTTNSEQRY